MSRNLSQSDRKTWMNGFAVIDSIGGSISPRELTRHAATHNHRKLNPTLPASDNNTQTSKCYVPTAGQSICKEVVISAARNRNDADRLV